MTINVIRNLTRQIKTTAIKVKTCMGVWSMVLWQESVKQV